MFPKLKKRIKSFLLSEEGRVTKASAIYLGAIIATASLAHAQCGVNPIDWTVKQAQLEHNGG